MKKIINHITNSLRILVVLTILFSIVANGAFAGQRVEKADKTASDIPTETQLVQGPPSPDELPQNMETSNKPNSEQQAYLKAVQTLNIDNNQYRNKLYKTQSTQILKELLNSTRSQAVVSTTSQVTSSLGRQFRLVGAKPSGTS